jgi:nucleotide-binding universal stress UspA family protein
MSNAPHTQAPSRPVLLCFDGSKDAENAIAQAGALLGARSAVVVTVWEPIAVWEPYDPSPFSAAVATLGSKTLGLDEIATEQAHERVARGVELARAAGFDAEGRVASGKTWRAICDLAGEIDAQLIVLGARGLSRVQAAMLGSVSSAVTVHAGRPVLVVSHTAA